MLRHKYIVIEGNIGAGKTTLAEMLSVKFNTGLLLESFAENTFLPQFYNDPERFAFPLEMSFMADRYRQLKNYFSDPGNRPVVSDYFFDKCLLFAKINLKNEELELFENFYNLLQAQLPRPDLIVFLRKETEALRRNILKRGRSYEKKISPLYLDRLNNGYKSALLQLEGNIKVLHIQTRDLDFVANASDYLKIINQIINT